VPLGNGGAWARGREDSCGGGRDGQAGTGEATAARRPARRCVRGDAVLDPLRRRRPGFPRATSRRVAMLPGGVRQPLRVPPLWRSAGPRPGHRSRRRLRRRLGRELGLAEQRVLRLRSHRRSGRCGRGAIVLVARGIPARRPARYPPKARRPGGSDRQHEPAVRELAPGWGWRIGGCDRARSARAPGDWLALGRGRRGRRFGRRAPTHSGSGQLRLGSLEHARPSVAAAAVDASSASLRTTPSSARAMRAEVPAASPTRPDPTGFSRRGSPGSRRHREHERRHPARVLHLVALTAPAETSARADQRTPGASCPDALTYSE